MGKWKTRSLRDLLGALGYAYGVIGVAYLIWKAFFPAVPPLDFPYFWVAGDVWRAGVSPYSEAYAQAVAPHHGEGVLLAFVYPPSWWVITVLLAQFDVGSAAAVWLVTNAILLVAGGVLLFCAIRIREPRTPLSLLFAIVGFVATSQETALTLYFGQSSILIYFGFCALLYGMVSKNTRWMVAGAVLCLLKPQIGIVVWVGLLLHHRWRRAAVISAGLTGVLMLPPLIIVGFSSTVFGFIESVLSYSSGSDLAHVPNSPAVTTGLGHLLFDVTGFEFSSFYFIAAAIVTMATALVLHRAIHAEDRSRESHFPEIYICGAALLISAVIYLHGYDLILLASIIPFLFCVRSMALKIALAAGMLVIYRALNLTELTGWRDAHSYAHPQVHLESVTTLFMFLCFLAWMARQERARSRRAIAEALPGPKS